MRMNLFSPYPSPSKALDMEPKKWPRLAEDHPLYSISVCHRWCSAIAMVASQST